jgi:hypothetical protein
MRGVLGSPFRREFAQHGRATFGERRVRGDRIEERATRFSGGVDATDTARRLSYLRATSTT